MSSENYLPVASSNIQEARRHDGDVLVKFRSGAIYRYYGIPDALWAEFKGTFQTEESTGKFLNEKIKGKYKHERLG